MQKFTAILEKNVEWFALGIAGLFFCWMLYSYIVTAPVTATVGSTPATPGEVDTIILNGPAKELDRKTKDESVPKIAVANFGQEVESVLSNKNVEIAAIPGVFGPANIVGPEGTPPPVPGGVGPTDVMNNLPNGQQPNSQTPPAMANVVQLPQPPAPINLQFSQGRSNVS